MMPALIANNIIGHSEDSSFEVRVADVINAYDWLSPDIIEAVRDARTGAKITNSVNELLTLALLVEHGGIMFDLRQFIMLDSIQKVARLLGGQIKKHLEELKGTSGESKKF